MSVVTRLYAFDERRADNNFSKLFNFTKKTDAESIKKGKSNKYLNRLIDAYKYSDEGEFLSELRSVYLDLGSKESVLVNSSIGEDQHIRELECLCDYFNTNTLDSLIPSKEGFIDMYSSVNMKSVDKVSSMLKEYGDESSGDAKWYIVNTLKHLKPLVKELRDNKNSILLVSHDYDWPDVIPDDFNDFLNNKIEELKNKIYSNKEVASRLSRGKK